MRIGKCMDLGRKITRTDAHGMADGKMANGKFENRIRIKIRIKITRTTMGGPHP